VRTQARAFTLPLSYRYDLALPERLGGPLLVTLHGYGQSKRASLAYGRRIGQDWPLAALQAPHPHHRWRQDGSRETGYGWVSDEAPEEDVGNHHLFVEGVIERVYEDGLIAQPSAFLFGFSQAVSLNYRFAATHPERVLGLVAVAGATPSSWVEEPPPRLELPVLHLAMTEDAAYPLERARGFRGVLEAFTSRLSWFEPGGGHRVPRAAYPLIRDWLAAHAV
jgi:predicted esterase